ncbi:MAG: DUF6152 family protein [Bryobacteraceae bacterium]
MKSKIITLAGFLIAAALPVLGHHSFAMFELTKDVTYEGTVVEYRWENPHTHIIVKVDPGQGVDPATVGTWDVEGGATNIMGRQGWTRATFKVGDRIKVVAHPMKDGVTKGASLFYAIMPDGKRLYHDIARPKGEGGGQ